jgi:23S rRNA (adenine-N6)-dimethyltransferase
LHTYHRGRHEHGQNFLHDKIIQKSILGHVKATTGPIIEIGPGAGALTKHLVQLKRPLRAVETDRRLAHSLVQRVGEDIEVVHDDFLHYRLPHTPHVLVGNLPFHLTTAILRRIFRAPGWTHAVLLVQWEVARRRAGVGGATMMTAQWWPWFNFELGQRVPARAFTPRPNVDGGVLLITRREEPLLPQQSRSAFQSVVHKMFTGRGQGIAQIASRAQLFRTSLDARKWAVDAGLDPLALPKDLSAHQWVALFQDRITPRNEGRRK